MTNWTFSFPIFGAALLLVASGPFLKAEPGVPTDAPPVTTPASPAPITPPAVPEPSTAAFAERPATYTIVSGDSLWTISHKFKCSIKDLETLNKLQPHALLHPGQVLQIPPATSTPPAPAKPTAKPAPPKTTSHPAVTPKPVAAASQTAPTVHHYPKALPVDLNVPASTFASCPVPIAESNDSEIATPVAPKKTAPEKPAPVAKPVSPSEFTAAAAPAPSGMAIEPIQPTRETSNSSTKHSADLTASTSSHGTNPFFTSSTGDWSTRFTQEARLLGNQGIEYDEDWRPPGEAHSWVMDCSNTTRYLYKVTTGIQLPRTASDQYYYLHLQNKAWDVPQASNGFADCNFLRENLKPGDLLFWENTYRPERQPPITHVMVFLGTNDKGQWIMAGSQTSRGGEHNRRNGGPDIYVFNPTQPCGGYTTWMGLVHHQGRFCAFGRPLEADKSKLAVAAND